jgi:glycerol-3-phosphate cytidylyltransferase
MNTRIGYAAGAFDLFHIGHLNILRQAKSQCDYLVAGVVSDELCVATKGRRPVVPLIERLEIVSSIGFVDRAVAETHTDRLDTWKDVGFNVFFKGDDWRGTPKGIRLERAFAEVGVEVVYFPYTVHTSSTTLRRALEAITDSTQRAMVHQPTFLFRADSPVSSAGRAHPNSGGRREQHGG